MAFEDSFLDELDATPTSSKESMQILQDFRDDWEKQNNNYQGWLSVGASPEDAAARTIVPVREKWNSFAPVMKSMINPSRSNPFSIFSTGGGELTRANKFTGEADVIKEGRPAITRPDAFETVVEETEAVKGKPSYSGFMGTGLGARPAVPGTPKKTVTRKNPINRPVESFDDELDSGPQTPAVAQQPSRPSFGFMGTPEGFNDGAPFGDNDFEMPGPSRNVAVSAPEPSRRKKGQIYQTPKGPLRWSGTGWLKP